MADEVQFIVEKLEIGKVWDKSMARPAGESFQAGVEKALGAAGGKVVKSLGKDAKGFKLTLTMESLEFDEKKALLSQVVKGMITAMPEDKYLAGLTHKGKLPDVNAKKIEADVKFLCSDSGSKLGALIRKEIK